MRRIKISIDGKEIECLEGEILLKVALRNDIYIPNLCFIEERKEPYGACRLCFVEIEGEDFPCTSCTIRLRDGMRINRKGKRSLRLAKTAFELILSNHPVDCLHCSKSGLCELQRIARYLGVRLKSERFQKVLKDLPIDDTGPAFTYNPNKCVLCGRCIWFCHEKLGVKAIGFGYRGFRRCITTFGDEPIGSSQCREVRELIDICPVGAFVAKESEKGSNNIK
ncbi:MAG: 2Fe-2S iron-sulfur cluster-binding protein [Candidatus Bathyarchaeia archaeon]